MFLVMGITGKVGGATAEHLLAQGKKVRALVRNREKAANWAVKRQCRQCLCFLILSRRACRRAQTWRPVFMAALRQVDRRGRRADDAAAVAAGAAVDAAAVVGR